MPRKPAQFEWNAEKRRYYYESGRAVPLRTLEGWIDTAGQNAEQRIENITRELIDKKINITEWALQFKQELRNGHNAMAMIANGGREQMTPQAWGKAGAVIKNQFKFLDNFTRQIENGDIAITDTIIARARMYGSALYPSYVSAVKEREILAGATEERSVLTPADGWCNGCLEQAALGWVSMGELIPLGDRQCLTLCRCGYETR